MASWTSMNSIPEFYADKTVFITGATGFIGKVLIEKLLRSCPRIKDIYCLIRPKKGHSAVERLKQRCTDKLFDSLREQCPDFDQKLHAVHGDILEDGLGLRDQDRALLEENVQIVFHGAATVRFDEALRLAMEMNVLGVRRTIQVCRKFRKLEVFVHVSTSYANCDRAYIEEVVYPPPIDPQRILDALDWFDDEMLEAITPKLLGDKPNTYTYTKQLAESLLIHEGDDLPLAIVRPSIVTASWKEPVPGWIDNWNGPTGMSIAIGKGILRSNRIPDHTIADFIPVDLCTNLMIAVGWYTVVRISENAMIYHINSGTLNPVRWSELVPMVLSSYKRTPMDSCFRRPNFAVTPAGYAHNFWTLVSHMIPAYLADLGFVIMGKHPRMVKIYNKLHKILRTVDFFSSKSWEWTHNNMDMLKKNMSLEDQQTFFFDPRAIEWGKYLENYCIGAKTFVLKEDMSGLPAARAHLRKLRLLSYIFKIAVLAWPLWLLVKKLHTMIRGWSQKYKPCMA